MTGTLPLCISCDDHGEEGGCEVCRCTSSPAHPPAGGKGEALIAGSAPTPSSHDQNKPARVAPPFADQTFSTFDQWVNRASSWLTCHREYRDTEHGEKKGWRGHHFTALCFDSFGRRCRIGADMHRARDEGAFPVWWIWPDQIVPALQDARGVTKDHTDD